LVLKTKAASIDILDLITWGKIHTKVWTQNTFIKGYMRPESVSVRIQKTWNRLAGTDTRTGAGQPKNHSFARRDKRIFSSPKCADWL